MADACSVPNADVLLAGWRFGGQPVGMAGGDAVCAPRCCGRVEYVVGAGVAGVTELVGQVDAAEDPHAGDGASRLSGSRSARLRPIGCYTARRSDGIAVISAALLAP